MKDITSKVIDTYSKKYGIQFTPLGDIGWVTYVGPGDSGKEISISKSQTTIFFSIYPLLEVKCKKCKPQLAQHLLLLNSQTPLVKYSVDADWNILLSVEYPIDEFSYELFKVALDALIEALEKHYPEILEIAKD